MHYYYYFKFRNRVLGILCTISASSVLFLQSTKKYRDMNEVSIFQQQPKPKLKILYALPRGPLMVIRFYERR